MLCANCGKNTKRKALVDDFDLTELAGVPATVKRMRVYRCATCHNETIAGPDLERALGALTSAVASSEGRLTADEARFLRKCLALTQEELGARLGANKITISDWERGDRPISEHYDYILRSLVLSPLISETPPPSLSSQDRRRIVDALSRVHGKVPKKARLVLPAFL